MAARVVFQGAREVEKGEPYVTVPAKAVVGSGKDAHVFVVHAGRAERRAVVLGDRKGTSFVATHGLEGGEDVVLDPPPGMKEGDVVHREGGA
jgi:HlyD family secretion protein